MCIRDRYIVALITGLVVLSSCNDSYKFTLTTSKKLVFNDQATAKLTEKNNKPIDSIHFFVNGKRVASQGNEITFSTSDLGVGKFTVSALVFYPEKTKKKNNSIEILSNVAPASYKYKLINTYPHDKNAYTQGLEFHNGFLYETTGQRGKSVLRKVELKTGKVLQEEKLDAKYFGEGMTILNDKIYWLTWQAKKGFTYDLETFKQEGDFSYSWSQEGWGLTNNGTDLLKSDGSHKIYFLDGNTQQEKKSIQAYYNKGKIDKLNELEMINVFDTRGHINDEVPEAYRGLDRFEARKRIVADIEAAGLLDKIEDHLHMVPFGDRGGVPIEPYLTDQWFVNAEQLAKPAIKAVEEGRTKFVPENLSLIHI